MDMLNQYFRLRNGGRKAILALTLALLVMGLSANSIVEADQILNQADQTTEASTTTSPTYVPELYEAPAMSGSALRNAYLLLRLQDYLGSANQTYASLQTKMDETRSEIDENRSKILTLEEQIRHLEKLSGESSHKIKNVEVQIAEKERDIAKGLEAIEFNEIQRSHQRRALSSYLKLLYFENNLYFDSNHQANSLKLLLQADTLSGALQKGTYINLLEKQAEQMMVDLQKIEANMKASQLNLSTKRHQLAFLGDQLDGAHRDLEAQLDGKKNLLEQTRGSDEIYRELFASYKIAQQSILNEINLFENNIDVLDERIALLAPQLTQSELAQIDFIRSDADLNFAIRDAAAFLKLSWPVSPSMGLTAFFDDSAYTATFGVAHRALDIRIPHGSVIMAPADGVVYRVQDTAALEDHKERLGYGYMILAHRKGVMTLFGHTSLLLRREGEFVRRGDILGLTGGTPGTPGAGGRTTGAHLHMEVFQDGVQVDPLEYLSLSQIPEDEWGNIPEKYLRMLEQTLEEDLMDAGLNEAEIDALDQLEIEDLETEIQETLEYNPLPDGDSVDDEFNEQDFWSRGA